MEKKTNIFGELATFPTSYLFNGGTYFHRTMCVLHMVRWRENNFKPFWQDFPVNLSSAVQVLHVCAILAFRNTFNDIFMITEPCLCLLYLMSVQI